MPLGTLREEECKETEGDGGDHRGDHEVPPVGKDVSKEGEGEPADDPGHLAADPDDGLRPNSVNNIFSSTLAFYFIVGLRFFLLEEIENKKKMQDRKILKSQFMPIICFN